MPEIFYTSDLHIGHKLVAEIRRFIKPADNPNNELVVPFIPDPDWHAEHVARNWDMTVGPKDTVYVLGDISINGKQHALDWIAERPGTKHLIAGNHDPVHPGIYRTRAHKLMPHWLEYFETIQPFTTRKLENRYVMLSHFPYAAWGDGPGREGSRYDQYRLPDMGALLLHGHTHGEEVEHGNEFHVGLDAHDLQLVPQDRILEWIRSKEKTA